jgi:glycosyltransferase involved in cell wall biosynthesis
MSVDLKGRAGLRIVSIVEALTVTGPVKPLLMFSALTRIESAEFPRVSRALLTTRRSSAAQNWKQDKLYIAAADLGLDCFAISERRALDPGVLSKMTRVIERVWPDIVETHDSKSHFLFFMSRLFRRRIASIKWICFHHGYTSTSWKVRLYQQLDRVTLRRADHVVTLCNPFAEDLKRRGVRAPRLSVISNALAIRPDPEPSTIALLRASLGVDASARIILCVGRLSREKGQDDLIAAFQRLLANQDDHSLRLVIVGDGPERRRFERMATVIGSRVIFTGQVADPWPLFHAASVFALPSHSEGSPLVVLEAMAARVPIIATNVGGISETLRDHESALLVPPRDPVALSAGLSALLNDRSLRQRLVAAASAHLANFSPQAYARRLLSIYELVMRRP